MKNRVGLNKFLSQDRKTLYMVLSVLVLSIFTLTMAYAALSTTLNINGTAEVTAANWDIYLDNVQLNSNSATANVPTITNKTTASFSTTLSKPGDYYMFTIDVVNNGTIDAMIASITKTPDLTDAQKKYLNYIVEYQNGEIITTKQLVSKKSFVRLKVKVEFRKDLTASELLTTSETLNLSFKVNYTQSDDSNENITIDNNGKLIKVVSGDLDTVGSEVAIGDEHFYIISNTDGEIAMLSKYNLYVGGKYDGKFWTAYGEEATGIQDSEMIGESPDESYPRYGTTAFSSSEYWGRVSSTTYVYDNNSTLYNYVENYRTYLESQGAEIEEARLIKVEELEALGCSRSSESCTGAPEWVYGTSYWSGTAYSKTQVWGVLSDGTLVNDFYPYIYNYGVKPVIVLKS